MDAKLERDLLSKKIDLLFSTNFGLCKVLFHFQAILQKIYILDRRSLSSFASTYVQIVAQKRDGT